MSANNTHKRKKIFDIFSKNMSIIKSHPDIRFSPDFENGYVCPLCFDPFFENDLNLKSKNPLTLEDVPPKSLGGNPKILTCKDCNSKSGHLLDNHLLQRLKEQDAKEFLPNTEYKTTFSRNGNQANGIVKIDKDGKIVFDIQPQRSNPKSTNRFMKDVFPAIKFYNPLLNNENQIEPYRTNEFSIKFPVNSNERRSEVALLRIGYLLAYSIFGSAFLINGALYKVREQILNPDKDVLPKVFWIRYDFPNEMLGMNIIKSPKELMCFVAIFNLSTESKVRQFAVALPGPSAPGIKIYENIEKILCTGDGFRHIEIEHIPDIDFVKNVDYAWGAHAYWQKFTTENEKNKNTSN